MKNFLCKSFLMLPISVFMFIGMQTASASTLSVSLICSDGFGGGGTRAYSCTATITGGTPPYEDDWSGNPTVNELPNGQLFATYSRELCFHPITVTESVLIEDSAGNVVSQSDSVLLNC